ncbi:MAG: diguanylate cyclase [Deltaproteobacteria bacterium]|nr:diguanylate cyclase [Deltaproteobacteria bacterium]
MDAACILIVEDDAGIRDTTHAFIGMSGFEAVAAGSGEEALEILEGRAVDVVIADISLPGMDGFELTDRIKRDSNADVILITGHSAHYSYEDAISQGASDFLFKPVHFTELLLRLKRVLKERNLARERGRMLEQLQTLATTDGLTKLFNARHFYNQLSLEVDRAFRYQRPLSLLLLDIDHFKVYNDTFGHLEGDKVLVRLARIIEGCLRKLDSAYRYGGEEFTVILPETCGEEAETVAHRIKQRIAEEPFCPLENSKVMVTVSIGVTQYLATEEITELVRRADNAMYQSKQDGRNRVTALLSFSEFPS